VLIHGDAAFAGQGVVAETLNMSQLEGYRTGGTIHLIINNQIGYTTLPEHARSTRYSTDIAKMLMVPIFHVHGENPEAVVQVIRLAVDYRWRFGKDVVIDVVCYRRYGHNEGDEPYFTQPQMYDRIRERPSLHRVYREELIGEGVVAAAEADALEDTVSRRLEESYDHIHGSACALPQSRYLESWDAYHGTYKEDPVDTAVTAQTLIDLARKLNRAPDKFNLNPKLKRLLDNRLTAVEKGSEIDWANAEALAFASLLLEGFPIRLSGQDSGRGTFSQRHSVLIDVESGEKFVPLQHLSADQARFEVYDSLLSEAGVMGFEYGYSTAYPEALVLWEAQFGDFANNAQAVIDLFIASGQTKWQRLSGLVLLLPHGFEGLGPEHSSARLERFLQLCAEDNMLVCNPSTPAQYFHLLRRQMNAPFRKPLIVMTPKSLLRHPLARSTAADLTDESFEPVLDDPADLPKPEAVLICSGKIYYELFQRREELSSAKTAILRLEQFYPFPERHLATVIKKYRNAASWSWVQEEPENMGGWQFVRHRLPSLTGRDVNYIGREAAASPASGYPNVFKRQQAAIVDAAVGSLPEEATEKKTAAD
jgi:2-oxoglutarate dehydrogenase E1 component